MHSCLWHQTQNMVINDQHVKFYCTEIIAVTQYNTSQPFKPVNVIVQSKEFFPYPSYQCSYWQFLVSELWLIFSFYSQLRELLESPDDLENHRELLDVSGKIHGTLYNQIHITACEVQSHGSIILCLACTYKGFQFPEFIQFLPHISIKYLSTGKSSCHVWVLHHIYKITTYIIHFEIGQTKAQLWGRDRWSWVTSVLQHTKKSNPGLCCLRKPELALVSTTIFFSIITKDQYTNFTRFAEKWFKCIP